MERSFEPQLDHQTIERNYHIPKSKGINSMLKTWFCLSSLFISPQVLQYYSTTAKWQLNQPQSN